MHAMTIETLGDWDSFALRQYPDPQVQPGEVLIDVAAAGCNFFDGLMVAGLYQIKPEVPFAPGGEAAGTVLAVGTGVVGIRAGDRVLALVPFGAFATRISVPAVRVFRIPPTVPFVTAAAFAVVYQSAYFGLIERAHLTSHETVLVHAAAGGVGLAAVQIARALGARVLVTAGSEEKVAVAVAHGAERGFVSREAGWSEQIKEATGGRGVDVVFDSVGGEVTEGSLKCIAFGGRHVVVGFASGKIPSVALNRVLLKNISLVGLHWGAYFQHDVKRVAAAMDVLLRWLDQGKLAPLVSSVRPITEAREALQDLSNGRTTGKVVLEMPASVEFALQAPAAADVAVELPTDAAPERTAVASDGGST